MKRSAWVPLLALVCFATGCDQKPQGGASAELPYLKSKTATGWDQPPVSMDEAVAIASEVLPQVVSSATNMNPICVLETKEFYDVVYPMIVPADYPGDHRKTEVLLPKRKGARPEIKLQGISETELIQKLNQAADHK